MWKELFIIQLTLAVLQVEANVCPEHFVSIGNFCYYFSDIAENWDGARGVCAGIGSLVNEYTIPAVLDLGTSIDNQLLINMVNNQSKSFWLGGHFVKNKMRGRNPGPKDRWQWIYHQEKEIDLHANYWMNDQPDRQHLDGYCVKTKKIKGRRSYLQSEKCSEKLYVLCQIIPKEFGFRDIGDKKFYFSGENNNSNLDWIAARNVCQSLNPPEQFDFVDLAILDDSTEQELLKAITHHGCDPGTWLGGRRMKDTTNTLTWIDGTEINMASYFLDPNYWSLEDILDTRSGLYTWAKIESKSGISRATVHLTNERFMKNNCFVCQAYKN